MNRDSDQTSCSPWNTDSHPLRHYHSDLNSIVIVCFPPEGSVQQGICRVQTSPAKLFGISSTTSTAWLLNPALGGCVFSDYSSEQSTSLPGFSVVLLLRFHPTDRQTAVFLTMVPAYQCSVLEFGGLEATNLIDFFPPSQSPDSKRSFWSVSVLTSSQLALDMSMSSPVWSGWCFCVSH